MMGTTADKLEYLQGTKAAIKEAIVNKGVAVPDGTTFRAYAEKIGDIIDVPDLSNPGSAEAVLEGYQLVGADGNVVTGTLPDRTELNQGVLYIDVSEYEGEMFFSPQISLLGMPNRAAIDVNTLNNAPERVPVQAAKTVTPGTSNQTAVASGRYTTGDVVVSGDANLVPENIAEGVSIFGVDGTHSGGGAAEVHGTIPLTGKNAVQSLRYSNSEGIFDYLPSDTKPSDITVTKNSYISMHTVTGTPTNYDGGIYEFAPMTGLYFVYDDFNVYG